MTRAASPEQMCRIAMAGSTPTLYLSGHWRLNRLGAAAGALKLPPLGKLAERQWQIDGSGLQSVDTATALIFWRRLRAAGISPANARFIGFAPSHQRILSGVVRRLPASDFSRQESALSSLGGLGQSLSGSLGRLKMHVSYFGVTLAAFGRLLTNPGQFRWREFFVQVQQTGISAIPVVSLVLFLIGAVMAYLLGMQASQYGANIYVVDGVTLGTVREFAPLLVSTVVAGRSGAAFTAQLGTMRMTEEIDAIRTLGMSAEQVLLIPRVLGLVVALPILVFVGDVMALAGAAVVCDLMLDITPWSFLERMQSAIGLRHYFIGFLKAPVFALVIAVIGCAMGFTVSRDTRSIGLNTTSTVVQCIVAVVLIDAMFAVLFQEIGW